MGLGPYEDDEAVAVRPPCVVLKMVAFGVAFVVVMGVALLWLLSCLVVLIGKSEIIENPLALPPRQTADEPSPLPPLVLLPPPSPPTPSPSPLDATRLGLAVAALVVPVPLLRCTTATGQALLLLARL